MNFGPSHSKSWQQGVTKAGGEVDYRLLPPFGKNGHRLFSNGTEIRAPVVGSFPDKLGFPVRHE